MAHSISRCSKAARLLIVSQSLNGHFCLNTPPSLRTQFLHWHSLVTRRISAMCWRPSRTNASKHDLTRAPTHTLLMWSTFTLIPYWRSAPFPVLGNILMLWAGQKVLPGFSTHPPFFYFSFNYLRSPSRAFRRAAPSDRHCLIERINYTLYVFDRHYPTESFAFLDVLTSVWSSFLLEWLNRFGHVSCAVSVESSQATSHLM